MNKLKPEQKPEAPEQMSFLLGSGKDVIIHEIVKHAFYEAIYDTIYDAVKEALSKSERGE